ncbi:MAG: endonuclease domain-containing protein [Leptolyngbyaceae cyanobacterium bins.302]|nr:endonuclease domain-containing protein [Leptolyngbyaceae cyanobacterium bins.302]
MTKLYNKTSEREKRRSLRHTMPLAERILWEKLRHRQVAGCKFRRQYSIDCFVVDFYTTKFKLAIEIDGDSHFEDGAEAYDKERQAFLEAKGIQVLRFTNQQVYKQVDEVIMVITQSLQIEAEIL